MVLAKNSDGLFFKKCIAHKFEIEVIAKAALEKEAHYMYKAARCKNICPLCTL